ncbi:TonB-dependent receptor [Chitinophaga rhizosphaerae]|uniref:TonB-dependent receptor n=1 Tax=Chitinophaga rhizosphaerae TaxID=1864947 RepID=UPI000F800846|nr:TonB-dependent receptor [Chitinophaga rhizosphaerae]
MKRFLWIGLVAISSGVQAQSVKGKIFGAITDGKEILPGGRVHWMGTSIQAVANENGVFDLPVHGGQDQRIVATFEGYVPDTISPAGRTYISITLQPDIKHLGGITVTDRPGAYVSGNRVVQTEVITRHELSKAACCDLAGCFGTTASVQPQTTNIVTNAQELRILGLSGVYNQVLVDGLPMINGLTYTYGISTYPGTLVDNIFVSKGTTSVLQGYESISGQINLETRDPSTADRLHLNAYINSFGEKHLNANAATQAGKSGKWHTFLGMHSVQPSRRVDGNDDGFLDLPLLTRYMVYNKWKYRSSTDTGFSAQFGLRFVHEKRTGGQTAYKGNSDKGSTTVYGQQVQYNQPEGYARLLYRFSPQHALALSASGSYHNQSAWFGITAYEGKQQSAYINLQHEMLWKNRHQLKYGASYRYQELDEGIRFVAAAPGRTYAGAYLTRLRVPGVFAENTFHWLDDKVVLITGVRFDHHQTEGWYFTPRGMLKYAIKEHHTFRASAGTGWRQVNLFSEQAIMLTSSRDIVFLEALRPEKAFNWGVSHTYRFGEGNVTGTFSTDLFSTHFSNQFFPEYDADPAKIIIRNFEGTSRSLGAQADLSLQFFKQLDVRAAYNYLHVYRKENGGKTILPFNPRNRAMAAVSFSTKNNRWQVDVNTHWFGKMKLPDTRSLPPVYRRPLYSSPYATVNLQGTFRWNGLELYAGCENIAGYRQSNPIISADNPFGQFFDLSSVWGPTRGRELYAGVRFNIR